MANSIFINPNLTAGGQTFGTPFTLSTSGLATTSTDGLILTNTTAATAGATVQISPRVQWSGAAWNSSGSASETDYFIAEVLPATVAGTTTATWKLGVSIAGGAVTLYPLTVLSSGGIALNGGGLTFNNNADLTITAASRFLWNSRTLLTSPADGQLNLTNNGATGGVGLDLTTADVIKVRTRAQTGYGTVDALGYSQGGVVLTSATAPSVASGFGSGAAVAHSNGTAAFTVGVGTTTGTTGVITMPTAPNGWAAQCTNLSSQTTSVAYTKQTATSQTSITIGNFSDIAGAHAWADNDVISIVAFPY